MKSRQDFTTEKDYQDYLRTYFAAMAMQGMLANSIDNEQGMEPFWHMGNIRLAECSVLAADALINALNETK